MRLRLLHIVAVAALTAPGSANQCNADNCARAVTGTNAQPASSIRREDCSSFFETTVTPRTV